MQNRRQKVFNRGGYVCAGGLDISIDKTPLICCVHILIGGQSPRWRRDCARVRAPLYLMMLCGVVTIMQ